MSTRPEAVIVINGHLLNHAQSMTLRVAVSHWLSQLTDDPLALGDDEHGRAMVAGYSAHLNEIQDRIFLNLNKEES